jgi:hypothetical protein
MQRYIADELGGRTDLLSPAPGSGNMMSPIQNAIQSAISKWEREPFWFNEMYDNILYNQPLFYAVPEQEFYSATSSPVAVPEFASIPKISKVSVMVNDNRYVMNPRTWSYIEDISVNPSVHSEFPIDYSYYAGIMRLYPIPAEQVPLSVTFNQYLTPLLVDGDSNAWTTTAYDLIRTTAKMLLAQEVLFDDELATRCKTQIYGDVASPFVRQMERGYLADLRSESGRRGGGGRIRPTYF